MTQEQTPRQLHIQSIKSILQFNAVRNPGAPALVLRGSDGAQVRVSYRKLLNTVNRLGTALLHRGLSGAHIAIVGRNSDAWCHAFLAVVCGVGVAVPVDRDMSPDSMLHLFRYAGVKAVFADSATLKKLLDAEKKLAKKLKLFIMDNDSSAEFPTLIQLMDEGESLIDEGDDAFINRQIDPDALAVLLFTSGTTDHAKAVMLSNHNICADLMLVSRRVDLTQRDSTLCVLPLHHAYQLTSMLLILYVGGSVSFCSGLRSVSRDLSFFSPSVFVTVPLMLEKMHKRIFEQLSKQSGMKRAFISGRLSTLLERFDRPDLRRFVFKIVYQAFGGRLRMIICGAAPLNPEIARDFALFGLPVIIGYGLTECSPIVMCNCLEKPLPDSVGQPLDEVSVKIVDPDESGAGELYVKGPVVMLGYYKNKKASAAVLCDGWFRTGDLGYCDPNGNYHITGRSKNVIVTKGGKNIYPEELEAYLNSDPVVLESLIFGEENNGDETVAVEVVPDEDVIREKTGKNELTNDDVQNAVFDVIRRLNRALPSYKTIRRVLIRREKLERNGSQKVNRNPDDLNPSDASLNRKENTK